MLQPETVNEKVIWWRLTIGARLEDKKLSMSEYFILLFKLCPGYCRYLCIPLCVYYVWIICLNTSFKNLEVSLKSSTHESFCSQWKVTEELEKVKQEMEEKGSSMTDGGE